MANNAEDTTGQGNIKQEFNVASTGLNLDNSINQIAKGQLSYALNAAVENFDSNSVNYQNEPGNEFCLQFPTGYQLIGKHSITEKSKNIFFLVNPNTNSSEIGFMVNNDCVYHKLVNASCLNFNVNHPIQKVVHKITNCTTEIYWTDGYNSRRYLDIENVPYKLAPNADLCDPQYIDELDCNQLLMQPNFSIPQLGVADVVSGGSLKAGTYQFAAQYSDAVGNPYTSFYSVTNPTPIADANIVTVNYNYEVGKSIIVTVDNLDLTGQFQYFNLAVIKTINNIPSVELIGTYYIEQTSVKITYSGQNVTLIQLTINDIFEKYPYYEIAQDVTAVKDVLIWDQLTSVDRVNYQSIANQISLKWETYKIPATENYANETNATNLRGYLRDEVYAFEISFLLKNGKQTDGFHIPGRALGINENHLEVSTENADFVGNPDRIDPDTNIGYSPYWKIYNTASVIGSAVGEPIGNAIPHEYGEFAYWESDQDYPCNVELWGELAGQKIRHHKFPDVLVSPIIESALFTDISGMVMQNDAVYPIGVKIDPTQINFLIQDSVLTQEQKDNIIGYKIIRGNRDVNKSIIAKGILRNVNKYTREEQDFYYPNYPYNDIGEDPFLNKNNNAWTQLCESYDINILNFNMPEGAPTYVEISYTDCNSNKPAKHKFTTLGEHKWCSTSKPLILGPGVSNAMRMQEGSVYIPENCNMLPYRITGNCPLFVGTVGNSNYDIYRVAVRGSRTGWRVEWNDPITGTTREWVAGGFGGTGETYFLHTKVGTVPVCVSDRCNDLIQDYGNVRVPNCKETEPVKTITSTPELAYRQVFNSPETSFGQPFLGNILKLENVMFGAGIAHHVEVKKNSKYRLLTEEAQRDALSAAETVGSISIGFNAGAMFTVYQSYLTIYTNGITRKNYAYSYNSIASYDYTADIENNLGIKQRTLDIAKYLIPAVQSVGEKDINTDKAISINNYNRESSVYLRTKGSDGSISALPYPSNTKSLAPTGTPIIVDKSRYTVSGLGNCATPAQEKPINVVSYYASLKNSFPGQWGQIYSYETIDTGFQKMVNSSNISDVVFGGDTFISRFAFKTKLPFFIDNRVGAPDDSDIFYDEIGNISYPKYWHSSRSILKDYTVASTGVLTNFISFKATSFDCPNSQLPGPPATNPNRTFYDGYYYLFAYGIPNFYCESSYNTDLRQAFNNKEGEFWPHVTTGIPDDWVQESFVSILNDNTYTYNVTFSKQNKENTFTHLPPNWDPSSCYTHYPFRAVYSDSQEQNADNRINNWLMYKPLSLFDFPQNYGKLTSLDGVQNGAILARFENKSLLYNNLLTMNTSNPQAAYLGNPSLFSAIPIDFAETDLGFVGSQHKFLLRIPNGQITIDAKRGQIFLIQGTQIEDLSAFGSGMNRFFTDHLAFEILRYFPDTTEMINGKTFVTPGVNIDNNYSGVGLHGVYDSKFDRIIITKLDYIPVDTNVKYDSNKQEFYIETLFNNFPVRTKIYLTDPDYFCNKSWTVSFNFNTKSWISFHSYLPNFYIGENNFFYSGLNACCDDFNFVALAGEMVVGTTTTTTTAIPATTTTTSTTEYIGCDIAGNVIITSCNLEGDAIITVPPTTTTTTSTICSRPFMLDTNYFYVSYQIGEGPIVNFTENKIAACSAISLTYDNPIANLFAISIQYIELSVGFTLYLNKDNTDCTTVPDGWYFTDESQSTGFVYHVVNGVIVSIENCIEITTTTTTTTLPCLSFTASTFFTEAVETLNYIDCSGANQTIIMGLPIPTSSIEFCCTEIIDYTSGITLTYNGECLL